MVPAGKGESKLPPPLFLGCTPVSYETDPVHDCDPVKTVYDATVSESLKLVLGLLDTPVPV